ncbi:MAG: hypothetical protein OXH27_01435 [Gammaproteobacteria bacterium]|nr:hypothetical protein [Gammaproteobacteria bacterium]
MILVSDNKSNVFHLQLRLITTGLPNLFPSGEARNNRQYQPGERFPFNSSFLAAQGLDSVLVLIKYGRIMAITKGALFRFSALPPIELYLIGLVLSDHEKFHEWNFSEHTWQAER